jgi:hypothetical protein
MEQVGDVPNADLSQSVLARRTDVLDLRGGDRN